jgi:hypothetical protein
MGKENFIPLSQANNQNLCEGRLLVNLPLPYGLDERIEIDPHRMDVLRQMAGFGRIILTRDDESGTSQVVPQIDGINTDGTATARKAKMKIVPESGFDTKDPRKISCNRASWPELKIKLNVEEIQQRLIEEREGNIHDQNLWATKFNKLFKNTVTKSGIKHLFSVNSRGDFLDTMWFSIALPLTFILPTVAKVTCLILGKIILSGIDLQRYGFAKKDEGYRMSLTLGPEVEKAVKLSVYSRIGSVIRARTEEKK